MIHHPAFSVEPWSLRETTLDLDHLAQTESLFALANGHIGLRGNLDEGEPRGMPGTYLAGFYEVSALPYAEPGYGYPEAGESVVNVTNGKLIRLFVEDEPFDIRYGELEATSESSTCARACCDATCAGPRRRARRVRVASTRLVSFPHRAIAAIRYEVEPLDGKLPVVLQSELVANEPVPADPGDPRESTPLQSVLVAQRAIAADARAVLMHATRSSALRIAAAMDHVVESAEQADVSAESRGDLARITIAADAGAGRAAAPGQVPGLRLVGAALGAGASGPGRRGAGGGRPRRLGGLLADQREYLDAFWERADVEVDGDAELQQAARFGSSTCCRRARAASSGPIAAKGLTGHRATTGMRSGTPRRFVLPVLTYTAPAAARDALRWRHSHAPAARQRARQLGLQGASFPWRTIARLGVLGLLARRNRRVPHQRRHRRRRRSLPVGRRGHGVRARTAAPSCWSRPPGCGARSDTSTRRARSASMA